jgi:hypothetical protein
MDVARFLSDLYSELQEIEREIRDLGLFDAGTDSRLGLGPGLSLRELEPFRKESATARHGGGRNCWLQ